MEVQMNFQQKSRQAALLIVGVLALAAGTLGQDRKPISLEEKRRMIVSARAGEINLVEGDVSVKAGEDWSLLVAGDIVKEGDVVRTGPGSRAEVLLNPGSYLRLSENSEFKFDNTSIDKIKINLLKGAAIVEAGAGESSAGVLTTVVTPKGQFSIVRAGVYRFNVDGAQRTEARVSKGKLTTGTIELREGREAIIGDMGTELMATDKGSLDTFDAWSKDRAQSLVAANGNLARTNLNLLQAGTFPFGSRWFNNCIGWWYFDPFFGGFVYVPDGLGFCSPLFSAYGYPYEACYYPTSAGYVEEPGEDPGKKHGKHSKNPGRPGPLPAATFKAGHQRPALGATRNAGTSTLARPTIGHAAQTYSAGHASSGHSGSISSSHSGGSFSSSASSGHASAPSFSSSSSSASSSASSSGGGGGHHGKN
jgi:hypothetical protein